jgi:transposase-like protein
MEEVNLIKELFVPDEERAFEAFRNMRWPDGVYCPRCKSYNLQKRGTRSGSQRYSCNKCGLNFSDLTGTIFANKNMSLGEMFYILHNIDVESVKRISEELERDWSTVDSLVKDFKRNLAQNDGDPILTGEVEIDEMYIHAGDKGVKKTKDNHVR